MRIARFLVALVGAFAINGTYAVATSPDAFVTETVREVQQIVRQDPALQAGDKQKTLDLVEKKILPHFDFERMTMLAVGKDWQRATPEQRQALVSGFRTLLVRTYSGAITTYKDYKIDVKPTKGDGGDNVVVRSQVTGPGGVPPVLMDYRLYRASDGWKVMDVAVEGVSLVTTYRTTFKSEIDRGGFDGLIKLIAKTSEPAASGTKVR
jgi:phospholipid transport system substrate-binding protein